MMRACLFAAAFLAGAAVMSLEMGAFRLVQPEFGGDITVWGSLISVFLGGLAIGAWSGGRLADVCPSAWKLGLIFAAAGILALAIPLCSAAVLSWTFPGEGAPLPIEWGHADSQGGAVIFFLPPDLRWPTLAAGALLFGLPAMLLGTVTPYATKLLVRTMPKLGAGVGLVSGVSTAGAILGTLGTAFYLVEWLGTRRLLQFNGVILILLALILAFADALSRRAGRGPGPL